MSIIKRFIKKFLNVFLVLLLFLSLNVIPIKAESDYTENDIFYSIGSFINSTMDGISTRLNEIEIIRLGKNYAKSLIDNGSRMSDIVRVRGNEFLFNPHGKTGIGNAIDSVYGAYSDFANYATSRVEDDRYIVNINQTYTLEYPDTRYDGGKLGFMVVWGNPNDNLPIDYFDYHHIDEKKVRKFNRVGFYGQGRKDIQPYYYASRDLEADSASSGYSLRNGYSARAYGETNFGVGASIPFNSVNASNMIETIKFQRVVFHNDDYVPDEDIVPYNIDDIPTKEDFVSKIEGTYEPGKFYSYNMDELISKDTIINGDYVTNNYLTVEKYIGDSDYDDSGSGGGKDYTSILDKILSAIKDLPKDIAKKLDFPEGSGGDEGGGFWSNLFGGIGDLGNAVSDLVLGLPGAVIDLLDGMLGLVERIVELFVPTAEQVEDLKGSLDLLVGDLTGKFDFVIEPINQIKTVYSKPQSIYSITIEYNDEVIYLFPHFLKSSIDKLKVLLNGAVVLTTFITIYKRFVGREDLIK